MADDYLSEITMDQIETFIYLTTDYQNEINSLLTHREEAGDTETLDLISMHQYDYSFKVAELFGLDAFGGRL